MNWFRMYGEFASDPKVQSMSEAMQRRLVMLFCLRCSNDLVTLHVTEIAFALRVTDEELAETKAVFLRKGFIDEDWNLTNWDKRQFVSDSSAARVSKHRAKKKEEGNGDVTLQKRSSNALEQNRTDTEQNKDYMAGFEQFYAAYPKKAKRPDAEKAFKTINPDAELLGRMLQAIKRFAASDDWKKDDGKYIPYPATWLRGKRWEEVPNLTVVATGTDTWRSDPRFKGVK